MDAAAAAAGAAAGAAFGAALSVQSAAVAAAAATTDAAARATAGLGVARASGAAVPSDQLPAEGEAAQGDQAVAAPAATSAPLALPSWQSVAGSVSGVGSGAQAGAASCVVAVGASVRRVAVTAAPLRDAVTSAADAAGTAVADGAAATGAAVMSVSRQAGEAVAAGASAAGAGTAASFVAIAAVAMAAPGAVTGAVGGAAAATAAATVGGAAALSRGVADAAEAVKNAKMPEITLPALPALPTVPMPHDQFTRYNQSDRVWHKTNPTTAGPRAGETHSGFAEAPIAPRRMLRSDLAFEAAPSPPPPPPPPPRHTSRPRIPLGMLLRSAFGRYRWRSAEGRADWWLAPPLGAAARRMVLAASFGAAIGLACSAALPWLLRAVTAVSTLPVQVAPFFTLGELFLRVLRAFTRASVVAAGLCAFAFGTSAVLRPHQKIHLPRWLLPRTHKLR